jgi:hypothetical protein
VVEKGRKVNNILDVPPEEEIKWSNFRRKKMPSDRVAFANPFPRKPSIWKVPNYDVKAGRPPCCWYNFSSIISKIAMKNSSKMYIYTTAESAFDKKRTLQPFSLERARALLNVSRCLVCPSLPADCCSRQILALYLLMCLSRWEVSLLPNTVLVVK